MSTNDTYHLTADELDAMLDGMPIERAALHVATCTICHTLVELDRHVVSALARMPGIDPAPGFDARVMARVSIHAPVIQHGVLVTARARDARRRVAVGAVVVGSALAAGFGWAAMNPSEALSLATPAMQGVGQTLWTSMQALAANATEQPWFNGARDLFATPSRAIPVVAGIAGVYAAALLGFRRLLAEPAANAGW